MRIIIIIVATFFTPCFAINNNYECISLGENCTTGAALQFFQLRNAAYPFDWTISPHKSLCEILANDFQDFLDPHYFSIRNDNHGIINKYGLVFVHDFPTLNYSTNIEDTDIVNEATLDPNWIKFLPEIQNKYARRIERLRDVCKSNKKIYFIRNGGISSQDEACLLRNIIKKTYPNLDFILVIVGTHPCLMTQWNEQNIKNYYLEPTAIWNDVAQWKKVFMDLGLEIEQDENRYVSKNNHNTIFNCSHCYPENGEQKDYPICSPKLLTLDKNHTEIRE